MYEDATIKITIEQGAGPKEIRASMNGDEFILWPVWAEAVEVLDQFLRAWKGQ